MTPPPLESAAASRARAAPGILERVQALLPQIAAYADETERGRRIAAPLVAAMLEAGLFRMLLPRPFNGFETDPLTFITAIEEIAKADASTAWSLCQTAVCAMVAAYLPPETAMEIFGRDPKAVLAWGPGPTGPPLPGPALYPADQQRLRLWLREPGARRSARPARCLRGARDGKDAARLQARAAQQRGYPDRDRGGGGQAARGAPVSARDARRGLVLGRADERALDRPAHGYAARGLADPQGSDRRRRFRLPPGPRHPHLRQPSLLATAPPP